MAELQAAGPQPDPVKRINKGAPKWLVTFGDLMALLLALFVLLLSFSEIDSESFKKNAGPINQAFNMPISDLIKAQDTAAIKIETDLPTVSESAYVEEWKSEFVEELTISMREEIASKQIVVVEKETAVVIRFPDTTAFPSGSSELREEILPALDKVATVLARTEGQINVAGHTDDIPITTAQFRSNWDLSTSRAVSVVHHLLRVDGIKSSRVSAQGYADSRGLAPNDSIENRAVNRRVEISIEIDPAAQ